MASRNIDGIIRQRPNKYVQYSAESAARLHVYRIRYDQKPALGAAKSYAQPQQKAVPSAKRRKRATKSGFNFKLAGALATLFLIGGFVAFGHFQRHDLNQLKEVALPTAHAAVLPKPVHTTTPMVDIAADMNAAIDAQTGLTASATLIDLDNNKTYAAGNAQRFETASTGKLITVFAYIHRVEQGKATLTQNIGGMSAQENIHRMIVYSDNDAWARMNAYLTFSTEQAYTTNLGLTGQFKPMDIEYTSADMAKLLQLLYSGQLMNDAHRAMIYDYMAHTTVTNLIQAVLPSDATVYHKYGQIDGVLHDASIVTYNGHHFVLVVYTNNPDGTSRKFSQQVGLIHAITTAAFDDINR